MRIYEKVHLVVATPGRILDLMEKKIADVQHCKILCLDEADKLLSQDFKGMLDRLISHLPEQRQILLYSATFPLTVEHFLQFNPTCGIISQENHRIGLLLLLYSCQNGPSSSEQSVPRLQGRTVPELGLL